jgi:L-serine/L-threonine ammonia-lyase
MAMGGGVSPNTSQLYVQTPLLRSKRLSDLVEANVWMKMETVQTSGSFKTRGLSNFAKKAVSRGCTKFVSSSGGNAGLAAAYIARELGLPITVVIPTTTPPFIADKLREEGANVEVVGQAWDDANKRALELAQEPGCELIHPFDHPDIWEGHSSIMDEVAAQLQGLTPDLVVLSVGGGGLMNGVLAGMQRVGWTAVPVLAMETEGAHSLNACAKANRWVELDKITSIATCLGAKRVSQRSYEWLSQHPVLTHTVTDRQAVSACINIADDHRVLVAPACGAALAALYTPSVLEEVRSEGRLPHPLHHVVVIVCGGNGVSLETIQQWKRTYDL